MRWFPADTEEHVFLAANPVEGGLGTPLYATLHRTKPRCRLDDADQIGEKVRFILHLVSIVTATAPLQP
jgi:hypothetical protein